MNMYECPDRIYKYMPFDGLYKTLTNGTFRLSRPSDFNDPLDMYLQAAYGKDQKAFFEDMIKAFLSLFEHENDLSSLPDSPYRAAITFIGTDLKNASPDQRAHLYEQMLHTPIEKMYDLKKLEQTEQEVLSFVRRSFEFDGVFCSTTDFKSLLMWAHYADKHYGAVIEFTPSQEKHSAFLASKKVKYSNERSVLYATAQEFVLHVVTMSENESAKAILDKLIYTKSSDWKYEQEYRLYVPFCIKPSRDFATLEYHPEELTSVFFGCRMSQQNTEMAMALAKAVNPLVAIYKACPTPRDFGLNFEIIS